MDDSQNGSIGETGWRGLFDRGSFSTVVLRFRMAKKPKPQTREANEELLKPREAALRASHQLPNDQAVDLQAEDSQYPNSGGTPSYSAKRSGPTCCSGREQRLHLSELASMRRLSGRNQLVGRIEQCAHQRAYGGGGHFHRRAANHLDHHCTISSRNESQSWSDRSGPHQVDRSHDSSSVT